MLDPKSKEVRAAYASVKEAIVEAKTQDKGLYTSMLKGAGGGETELPAVGAADANQPTSEQKD